MLYNIYLGGKIHKENIGLDELLEYRVLNPGKIDVRECLPAPARKQTEKRQTEDDFRQLLSAGQRNSIALGEKKIKWSDGIGWHLRSTGKRSEQEIHVSVFQQEQERKDAVRQEVRDLIVYAYLEQIWNDLDPEMEISREEFENAIKSLLS